MAKAGQRKCMCCEHFFDPDHRNRERQRYCSNAECRRASKAVSQAAWLAQPQNTDYFRGPLHVVRVQLWRAAHPGYSRGKARKPAALQEPLVVQVPEDVEQCFVRGALPESPGAAALQDLLNAPSPVLAGLIAHLFEVTLQDDMAATARRLVQLGHDVINRSRHEDRQARAAPAAAAPGARAVQLG
ncbi:MAG: hypothetical protein GEV05_26085 [Betaproteobacteria bacterium]|nr:hypothetical protein [Betaproteobacteria bacterium]